MQIDDILLQLSLIKGVGPGVVERLVQHIAYPDLAQLYRLNLADFQQFGISQTTAQSLVNGLRDTKILSEEISLLQKNNISWISCVDERYPALLKEIHLPPLGLYVRGSLETSKNLAVVGSRKANVYGQRVIQMLVPPLVHEGWAIVSGGALGADTMVHRATVNARGKTIVVLGSGLLQPYPLANVRLFDEIVAAGGVLVSSFSLQTAPVAGNFPARNRIISGLSQGCIVVQAAQESGASITAQYALEQGRELFAVPGAIDDELSAGCHKLLQQGAHLVTNAHDILQAFSFKINVDILHNTPISSSEEVSTKIDTQNSSLSDRIVHSCTYPRTLDELAEELEIDFLLIQQHLIDLQLQGKVNSILSGRWQRT